MPVQALKSLSAFTSKAAIQVIHNGLDLSSKRKHTKCENIREPHILEGVQSYSQNES